MQDKTLDELIEEEMNVMQNSDDELIAGIESTQIALFTLILAILKKFDVRDGRISDTKRNKTLLEGLRGRLRKAFKNSTYTAKVKAFFKNFEKVEGLNLEISKRVNDINTKDFDFSKQRKELIEEISDALITTNIIETEFTNPLRKILRRNIEANAKVSDIESALKEFVKGTTTKGKIVGRVRQIAVDAVSQHAGLVQTEIQKKYQFDGFMMVGSLIATSRKNCVEMINGVGAFKGLAIRPGVYAMEDIPKIIKIASKRPGWNPVTTADTYLIYKNGFGERHGFITIKLSNQQQQIRIRKIQERLAA